MARRRILRHFWTRHRYASIGLLLAVLITVGFGTRMIIATVFWSDPDHWREPPAGWMTIGFISKSWRIPPEVLLDTLSPDRSIPLRTRLEDLAEQEGIPLPDLLDQVSLLLSEQGEEP